MTCYRRIIRVVMATSIAAFAVLSVAQDDSPPARVDLHGDPLPPGALMRLGTDRFRGFAGSSVVLFAAGGRTIVTAGNESWAEVWEVESGRRIAILGAPIHPNTSPGGRIIAGTLSPDGRRIAFAHERNYDLPPKIAVWDARRYAPLFDAPLNPYADSRYTSSRGRTKIVFTADSRFLIVADEEGAIRLWDAERGVELMKRKWTALAAGPRMRDGVQVGNLPAHVFVDLAVSPDGRILAGATDRGALALWEIGSNEEPRILEAQRAARIAFSPDGKRILIGGDLESWTEMDEARGVRTAKRRAGARLLDLETGEEIAVFVNRESLGSFSSMAATPDFKTLALVQSGHPIHLWSLETGESLGSFREGPVGDPYPRVMAFSPDGRTLAIASAGGALRLWGFESGEPLHDFDDEYGAGTAGYAFTHDSRKLISTSGKGPLQVWDTASGRRLAMSEAFFTTGSINQIALSPDGDRIATSEFPGRIRLWDAAELTEIRQMPADAGNIRSLIFSSDGTRIVAGYSPSTDRMFANPAATPGPDERAILAEMWDVESGKIARRFELPLAGEQVRDVRFMAFGEKDERLIVVDVSGTVRVWEVETGILRFKFETIPGRGQVNAYALSPDQKQLALLAAAFKNIRVGRTSGSASRGDDAITFWDLETGEQVRRIEVGESLGVHLKIHPSGRSAFTGTFPMGQFRVVDLDSGAIVRRIAPPFQINWADPAFAPDGKSFAISAENGTIVIYALEW